MTNDNSLDNSTFSELAVHHHVDRGPGLQIVSSAPKIHLTFHQVFFLAPSTARFFLLTSVVVVVFVVVTNKMWINLQ